MYNTIEFVSYYHVVAMLLLLGYMVALSFAYSGCLTGTIQADLKQRCTWLVGIGMIAFVLYSGMTFQLNVATKLYQMKYNDTTSEWLDKQYKAHGNKWAVMETSVERETWVTVSERVGH